MVKVTHKRVSDSITIVRIFKDEDAAHAFMATLMINKIPFNVSY